MLKLRISLFQFSRKLKFHIFRLTFPDLQPDYVPADDGEDGVAKLPPITVESHRLVRRGPYAHVEPKRNTIRFTPTQVEAIKSGMQPGLTMVSTENVLHFYNYAWQ